MQGDYTGHVQGKLSAIVFEPVLVVPRTQEACELDHNFETNLKRDIIMMFIDVFTVMLDSKVHSSLLISELVNF